MWNKKTSIFEPEVEAIKRAVIANGLATPSVFEVQKNFDISSNATHYPIIFMVDVSSSLRAERENLNRAISSFVKDILGSRTTLSSSVDFAIVTFGDKVKIKRPFGYITDKDLNNSAKKVTIGENDIERLTKVASGMFVSWYIAEKRKLQYKEAKANYRQPIFVLISDLCNNEKTQIDNEYLMARMISLYNMKFEGHKLGVLKALFGDISNYYNKEIKGITIDAPVGFADMLSRLFSMLVSTIADPGDADYLVPDEDDREFLMDRGALNTEINKRFTSNKLVEIQELFNKFDDDGDE